MGWNLDGELGDGTYGFTNQPEQIVSSGVVAIATGRGYSLFLKSDGSLWGMGANASGQLGNGTYSNTNNPVQVVAGSPRGHNLISSQHLISSQFLSDGSMRFSFVGLTGTNYALERTFNLAPAYWVPQVTNPAGSGGLVVFTNIPNASTNNFWRIRSAP